MRGRRCCQRGEHLLAPLAPAITLGIDAADLDLRNAQVERRALLDAALAQRRQHIADVVEEDLVRPDHEHAVAHQPATVLEQEVGGAVKPHGGLPGAGPALHDEHLIQRGADDDVLLGLDRGHDLLHRTRSRRTDLGQHRIRDARARCIVIRIIELLVEVRGQVGIGEGEPAPVGEAERIRVGGAIERRRDRGAPIHHHRFVAIVLDVSPPDVPAIAGRALLGDPAEELPRAGRSQVLERLGDGDLDVLLGDLVGRRIGVQRLESFDHPVSRGARGSQVLTFRAQLRERIE